MKTHPLTSGDAGIEEHIHFIRGHRVMLDKDLAELYGVPTKVLNQAVNRNISRFPEDFMFQLTTVEAKSLRSQIVTLKRGEHSKHLPRVFTQEGVAMLSGVLRSERAVEVNIAIMRTFVRLRQISLVNSELAARLAELEGKLDRHDADIETILQTLNLLISQPEPPRRTIGFPTE